MIIECLLSVLLTFHRNMLASIQLSSFLYICNLFSPDERLQYLQAAYSAPEEMLLDLKVRVGLLGVPRKEFDPMLTQRERTSKTFNKPISEAPEFKLPTRIKHP